MLTPESIYHIRRVRELPGGVQHLAVYLLPRPIDITAEVGDLLGRRVHGGVIVTHLTLREIHAEISAARRTRQGQEAER